MINNKGFVRFHLLKAFSFPDRKKAKMLISDLIQKEKKNFLSLDYIFCSDDYLLGINRTYLKHDDFTDIITFDLSANNKEIMGEIYISVDRVKENARIFNTSMREELFRVMFHGALHLCGYKDKLPKDKKLMRSKEDYYLASL